MQHSISRSESCRQLLLSHCLLILFIPRVSQPFLFISPSPSFPPTLPPIAISLSHSLSYSPITCGIYLALVTGSKYSIAFPLWVPCCGAEDVCEIATVGIMLRGRRRVRDCHCGYHAAGQKMCERERERAADGWGPEKTGGQARKCGRLASHFKISSATKSRRTYSSLLLSHTYTDAH